VGNRRSRGGRSSRRLGGSQPHRGPTARNYLPGRVGPSTRALHSYIGLVDPSGWDPSQRAGRRSADLLSGSSGRASSPQTPARRKVATASTVGAESDRKLPGAPRRCATSSSLSSANDPLNQPTMGRREGADHTGIWTRQTTDDRPLPESQRDEPESQRHESALALGGRAGLCPHVSPEAQLRYDGVRQLKAILLTIRGRQIHSPIGSERRAISVQLATAIHGHGRVSRVTQRSWPDGPRLCVCPHQHVEEQLGEWWWSGAGSNRRPSAFQTVIPP
jgi:hypothetical protein